MFKGIEFWGIWRKEQQFAAGLFGNRNKLLFGMKGSIIHYDYGAFVKRRQKLIRAPEFKNCERFLHTSLEMTTLAFIVLLLKRF